MISASIAGSSEPIEVTVLQERGMGQIRIADRGAGLGETDPEWLFEAFHTTKKSGTGLGLAIVRRLLSLQDGTINLLPRDGGGTIARVTLPAVSADR